MTKKRLLLKDVKLAAKTKWDMIYQQFGIDMPRKNVHSPCPACGGDDRFRYDDRKDDGDYFCNGCGGGDGFKLVEKVTGLKLPAIISEVAEILGIGQGSTFTNADRERIRKEVAVRERMRQEEVLRLRAAAQKKAKAIWAEPSSDVPCHYLIRKKVENFGCKVNGQGSLIVPLFDVQGVLWNVQTIDGLGNKMFLPKGRVRGCFHLIGAVELTDPVICIAEGIATGASIHMATGHAVAVAFNAGNLLPVGEAIRSIYPTAKLIYCADDDSAKEDTGRICAESAVAVTGGIFIVPVFDNKAFKVGAVTDGISVTTPLKQGDTL